ncbi:MAG: hypothetical protein HY690_19295 [Chloroflexi bacterium]|nr:hypothetical protein [Chloroflexota bacterium]
MLAAGQRVQKRPALTLAAGAVFALALLVVGYRLSAWPELGEQAGTISATDVEGCLRRDCDVHFIATLATQQYAERLGIRGEVEPRLRTAQAFVLSATAHVGTIRALSLDNSVFLRADGVTYPAAARPLQLTTHHNTYLVFFPRYDMRGRPIFEQRSGQFEVVVKDPQDREAPEHSLTFRFPLPLAGSPSSDLPHVLMVVGAAMAALLITCTPCLVGSLAVGSLATGTAASLGRREALGRLRASAVRQTLSYLAALIVLYLAVAMAVNLLKLEIDDLRPVEFLGGLALLAIGASFLRAWPPVARLEAALARALLQLVPGSRRDVARERSQVALGQGAASAMGASLAMVCSVAGAPTLSSAILLPLLVYAGLSSPFWAFLILLVYLLACAVPFFFVALGLGEFLSTASERVRGGLLVANACLLVGLGLLLLFSPGAVADAVAAPAHLMLSPLRWLL